MAVNLLIDRENKTTTMERVFDAPRELLWKAHTDPTMIPKWWGMENTTTIVDKLDVQEGGEWRYIHKGEKGEEYAFHGVFKELKEPEYITWTFNFEPIGPGHELTETMRFEEVDEGKTKLVTTSHYNTLEDLEGMLKSGMEGGADQTWNRLNELVSSMK